MVGHIKLDRKILSWEWYNDANTFRVFVHLLLMATHKDGRYKGILVKRGQVVTGRMKLATTLSLSEMEIRTSLNKLKTTNEITINPTNRFSVITICKYDIYQSFKNYDNQQDDQQLTKQQTNNQPTINQQSTTFNNVNKVNNEKNVNSNYIYNSEGAKTAPYGVPHDVIIPDKIFLSKDLNGLPDDNKNSLIRFLSVTKKVEIISDEVNDMWNIFKVQELTGQKLYRNKEDVYRHFLNWAKKQTYSKGIRVVRAKNEKVKKEINGIEFINNFTQVKMSDDSVQDLTVSQIESAKFNMINPTSIKK